MTIQEAVIIAFGRIPKSILLTAEAFVINRLGGLLYPSRERKPNLSRMSFDPRDRDLSEKSAGRAIDCAISRVKLPTV